MMKQGLSFLSAFALLQLASAGCCRMNQCLKAIAAPLVNGPQDCSSLLETVTITPEVTTVTATATEVPTESVYTSLVETDIVTETVTSTVSTETSTSTISTTVTAATVTQRSFVYTTRPYATTTVFVTSVTTIPAIIETRIAGRALSPSIPSYAAADCPTWDKYVSACKCVGVVQQTVTGTPSTATITVGFTESAFVTTISVPVTVSTTTTVVEPETATETGVEMITASLTETITTTVTNNVLVIGSTGTVTSTIIQTTVAAPVETCRSDVGRFQSSTTVAGADRYMYADTYNGMAGVYGSVKWQAPPASSASSSEADKYKWVIDDGGFLATTYGNTFKVSAYVNPNAGVSAQLMLAMNAEAPAFYLKVKGCVSSVTGVLALDAGGRKNILSCNGNLYISSGSGADTGLPCVSVSNPSIASV
ncbi:hypothetical protein QBC35DRAFT_510030 [Podospora australis]|uniref:Uncharacterized protein n=1 Tax=Podospora australis TaxID=1536484 RepID=A0AAN6WII3_9PEZI|nr:hypothetical protein QBC35DRAFT_510030 [Podospora australis]